MILAIAAAIVAHPINAGLEVRIQHAPQVIARSDGARLSYELRIASYNRRTVRLTAISVIDADSKREIASFDREELAALIGGQWIARPATDITAIAPGGQSFLFFDIPLAGQQARHIVHRVRYAPAERDEIEIETAPAAVTAAATGDLGAPLRGGPWTAVYSPEMELGHRRYIYAIDGVSRVPGRVAIDFFYAGAGKRPERYADDPGFGLDVLAVANGRVVAMRDDVPDPAGPSPNPVNLADATGNFIALDLGDGRIAFYEHLRRGVRVRVGERVRRGQVIASIGATGQVGGTHLHFHVGSSPDPLRTEGLGYRFERFDQIGSFERIQDVGETGWKAVAERRVDRALPAPNIVIRFPR